MGEERTIPRFLTVVQAAGILGLKPPTLRKWLAERRLPYTKLGRAVRIPADAVLQFAAENTIPAKATGVRSTVAARGRRAQ